MKDNSWAEFDRELEAIAKKIALRETGQEATWEAFTPAAFGEMIGSKPRLIEKQNEIKEGKYKW